MTSWPEGFYQTLSKPQFGLLAIGTGLITIHLAIVEQSGNSNLWGTSFVAWCAVASLLWQKRFSFNFKTSFVACVFGMVLISFVLLKSASYNYTFPYISPILSGLGVGLFASGWQAIAQYRKAFIILGGLAVLNLPFILFLDKLDISPLTAKFAAYILWYLGFNVQNQGQDLNLGQGGVVVYSGCSGLESILQLLEFAIIFAVLFPINKFQKIVMGFVAILIGFVLNSFRVALLAFLNVHFNQQTFEYWHQGTGSHIFSMIAVLVLGMVGGLLLRSQEDAEDSNRDIFNLSANLQPFRWGLILLTMIGIFLTLGKLWGGENLPRQNRAVSLPETVPLSNWQFVRSDILKPPSEATGQEGSYYSALGARKYHYRQNRQRLDIELWLMDNTNADVQRFASLYSSPTVQLGQVQKGDIRYVPGSGYYLHFVTKNRTYWSSCISAKGENTVTISQFTQKGFAQNFQLDRLLAWLLKNRSLFDRQCLWSNFSVPTSKLNTQNEAEKQIIKTWTEWTKWWQNSRILKS